MSDPDAILPDRITVLTCLGCGAMGREARCEGDCSEHKLLLVDAGDFDALQSAARLARQRNAAFKPITRALLDSHPSEQACTDAYRALRAVAHKALEATEPYDDRGDWQARPAQTGWWCAQCGNVDAPRPCIGVCVWRQTEWVNLTLYQAGLDRAAEDFRAAPEMCRILAHLRCRHTPRRTLPGQLTRAASPGPRRARATTTQAGWDPTSVVHQGKQASHNPQDVTTSQRILTPGRRPRAECKSRQRTPVSRHLSAMRRPQFAAQFRRHQHSARRQCQPAPGVNNRLVAEIRSQRRRPSLSPF
jgi:hypothetical protein